MAATTATSATTARTVMPAAAAAARAAAAPAVGTGLNGQLTEPAGWDVLGRPALAVDLMGRVEQVSGGDTLTVQSGTQRLRVRLLGIDAPELRFGGQSQRPWAEAAARQLRGLAPPGAPVRLIADRQPFDQYGHLLAHVYRGQRNVNVELLRRGWAVAYPIYPNVALLRQMQAATAAAQAARRGIFDRRHPLPLLPYEFRQRVENRPPAKLCGDARTRRYFAPAEYQLVPVPWRIFFYTEAEARAFGFFPAAAPAPAAAPLPLAAGTNPAALRAALGCGPAAWAAGEPGVHPLHRARPRLAVLAARAR
jgi:endonuclease YncB( thermonuclease family)